MWKLFILISQSILYRIKYNLSLSCSIFLVELRCGWILIHFAAFGKIWPRKSWKKYFLVKNLTLILSCFSILWCLYWAKFLSSCRLGVTQDHFSSIDLRFWAWTLLYYEFYLSFIESIREDDSQTNHRCEHYQIGGNIMWNSFVEAN